MKPKPINPRSNEARSMAAHVRYAASVRKMRAYIDANGGRFKDIKTLLNGADGGRSKSYFRDLYKARPDLIEAETVSKSVRVRFSDDGGKTWGDWTPWTRPIKEGGVSPDEFRARVVSGIRKKKYQTDATERVVRRCIPRLSEMCTGTFEGPRTRYTRDYCRNMQRSMGVLDGGSSGRRVASASGARPW